MDPRAVVRWMAGRALWVAVDPGGQPVRPGGLVLAFSTPEAAGRALEEGWYQEGLLKTVAGDEVGAWGAGGLRVWIEDKAVEISSEVLEEIRASIDLEPSLEAARTGLAWAVAALREYPGFWLVWLQDDDAERVALAPDGGGRKLVAIFTASDARDLYLERYRLQLGPMVRTARISGEVVGRQVAGMPVDGLVFDCLGPPRARAFSRDLARRMGAT